MKRLTLKNRQKEAFLFNRRLAVLIAMIILLIACLVARLIFLQIHQHAYYTTLSHQNQISLKPIPPRRGLIYDANHVLLAKNVPVYSLMVTRTGLNNFENEVDQLKKLIPITDQELTAYYKEANQKHHFDAVTLIEKLSEKQRAIFAVNRYRFPGFSVQARLMRQYPLAQTTANIVGYVGRISTNDLNNLVASNYAATNYIGKRGIEKQFEQQLHGTVGYQEVETDAGGKTVRYLGKVPAQAGNDIHLTIDANLQAAAEQAMQGLRGAVVAIQPNTGAVLALVSQPSYDPNLFVNGINQTNYNNLENNPDHPLYDRAISGLYAPGSTVKPFFALAGLNTGTITPDTKVYDPGWFKVKGANHVYHNWNRSGFGWVDLNDAILLSDDTYFYHLATKMGIEQIDDILEQFGFGTPTGIQIPGEQAGVIPSPAYKMKHFGSQWYTGDTVITGIGQGYTQVTALQLAQATAAIAMHGMRFKTHIVQVAKPQSLAPVIVDNPKDWNVVIQAMENVIRSPHGTGYHFGNPPYAVAAKTGTAQVYTMKNDKDDNVWLPERERDNSLFIAFAPVKNPTIAIAVIVENDPSASIVARKVLDYFMERKTHATTS